MVTYINIALIIISVLLILSVILQSKGAGLGGLSGADAGSVFTARRGVERTLFWITIVLSILFFALTITLLIISCSSDHSRRARSFHAACSAGWTCLSFFVGTILKPKYTKGTEVVWFLHRSEFFNRYWLMWKSLGRQF